MAPTAFTETTTVQETLPATDFQPENKLEETADLQEQFSSAVQQVHEEDQQALPQMKEAVVMVSDSDFSSRLTAIEEKLAEMASTPQSMDYQQFLDKLDALRSDLFDEVDRQSAKSIRKERHDIHKARKELRLIRLESQKVLSSIQREARKARTRMKEGIEVAVKRSNLAMRKARSAKTEVKNVALPAVQVAKRAARKATSKVRRVEEEALKNGKRKPVKGTKAGGKKAASSSLKKTYSKVVTKTTMKPVAASVKVSSSKVSASRKPKAAKKAVAPKKKAATAKKASSRKSFSSKTVRKSKLVKAAAAPRRLQSRSRRTRPPWSAKS